MRIGDYDIVPGATIGGAGAGALAGLAINEALNENVSLNSRIGAGLLGAVGGAALGTLGSMESKNPAKKPEVQNKRPILKGLLAGVPISAGAAYAVDRYVSEPMSNLDYNVAYNNLRKDVGRVTIRNRAAMREAARRAVILKRSKYAALAALAGLPIGAYVTLKNV